MAEPFVIRSYTIEELRSLYGVPRKTFYRWLARLHQKIGEKEGNWYTPKQVKAIVDHLGPPYYPD